MNSEIRKAYADARALNYQMENDIYDFAEFISDFEKRDLVLHYLMMYTKTETMITGLLFNWELSGRSRTGYKNPLTFYVGADRSFIISTGLLGGFHCNKMGFHSVMSQSMIQAAIGKGFSEFSQEQFMEFYKKQNDIYRFGPIEVFLDVKKRRDEALS